MSHPRAELFWLVTLVTWALSLEPWRLTFDGSVVAVVVVSNVPAFGTAVVKYLESR